MLKFGFGKRVKPRKFDFVPRFYDEQQDDLDSRMAKYNEPSDEDKIKNRIKSGLRQRYMGDNSYRSSEVRRSNFRLLYVFGILIFLCYLILKSNKFTQLIESLG